MIIKIIALTTALVLTGCYPQKGVLVNENTGRFLSDEGNLIFEIDGNDGESYRWRGRPMYYNQESF